MTETILERAIDDLDLKEFATYFLLPHRPKTLLENMTEKPISQEYEALKVFKA